MAGAKKGKGAKSKGSGKPKSGKPKQPQKAQASQQQEAFPVQDERLAPEERIRAVRPFWQTLSHEQRIEMLTIDVEQLCARAKELDDLGRSRIANEELEAAVRGDGPAPDVELAPKLEQTLEQALQRERDKGTWKVWQWSPGGADFPDADSFRRHNNASSVEQPAEKAFRLRMTELLTKVHASTCALHEDVTGSNPMRSGRGQRVTPDQIHTAVRDTNIELSTMMLEALEHEHEYLYHAVLIPITSFVCEMLLETMRDSTRTELFFEDLEKLPPDEVARICEWLTEKVDSFANELQPEDQDGLEEVQEQKQGIGDIDLFTLSEDGSKLVINKSWLHHLQERRVGDDGVTRVVRDGENPLHMGLVLEWIYGTIVSTAEKAREAAKRALGTQAPTVLQAHQALTSALQDHDSWQARAQQARQLLLELLQSNKQAAELAKHYDTRPIPSAPGEAADADDKTGDLPNDVILSMLEREVLLTRTKLHALDYEHLGGERALRSIKSQLRQGEPEFERLKRELEEVKTQPRGLEGTFRTAAELYFHRAQLADAALEQQLKVQTAFREHGSRLQGIYDNRQHTELQMARREEMKQLRGWKATVQSLIGHIEELSTSEDQAEGEIESEEQGLANAADTSTGAGEAAAESEQRGGAALAKLRAHLYKNVRRQLYTQHDSLAFYDWVQHGLGQIGRKLEEGRAALLHLEMHLINRACDDPGAAIGARLALPILQEHLDGKAQGFAAQRAAQAEAELLKLEEAQPTKKARQKAKAKVKLAGRRVLTAEEEVHCEQLRDVLCCPITQVIFQDPVIAADGQTYERSAIEDWLQRNNTSPMLNTQLPHKKLSTNMQIKAIVACILPHIQAALS
ncbi:hypothetical protein WJX72_006929 [[Myrmecia] bisecta]|uniref:U-box domain-containing protein n=1 Tax=[Myrmecia] bisecta TaxID=41462 RepID=A0AAW1QS23_9CHLO